eukprot:m.42685 g.42685  ORF g.42685 m.42685 type:complete len:259 (-) comp8351_c0_seq1:1461-2237(-)
MSGGDGHVHGGPSEAWVKEVSKEYSLLNVGSLSLPKAKFTSLGVVPLCTNLYDLNLSGNMLAGTLEQFSPLVNLEVLDLTDNQITSLKGAEALTRLSRLELVGNQIRDLADVADLEHLPALRRLSLAALHKSQRDNPICTIEGLFDRILALAPTLEILNGVRVVEGGNTFYTAAEKFDGVLDAVDKLKHHDPDPAAFDFTRPESENAGEAARAAEAEFDVLLEESKAALAAVEESIARATSANLERLSKPEVFITEKT